LVPEIDQRLSVRLSVAAFFQYPTIRELAGHIESVHTRREAAAWRSDGHGAGIDNTRQPFLTGRSRTVSSVDTVIVRRGETLVGGVKNRLLQLIARMAAPLSLRPTLHRWRGVAIGSNVYIGYDSIIETSYPWLISIGRDSGVGIRGTIIGHFTGMEAMSLQRGEFSVEIGEQVWIGPGVLILPNVKIGDGAVIAAGSTVTASIPAGMFAQGNPAKPVAKCGLPLVQGTSYEEFIKNLVPLDADSTQWNP
jgi:serine acetyltransferase